MTDQFQRAISAAAAEYVSIEYEYEIIGDVPSDSPARRDFIQGAKKALELLSQPASTEHGPRVWIFIYKDEQGNEFIEADRKKFGKKEEDQYAPLTELLAERAKRVWAEEKLQEEITQVEIRMSDRHQRQMNAEREKVAKLRAALGKIAGTGTYSDCVYQGVYQAVGISAPLQRIAREALTGEK